MLDEITNKLKSCGWPRQNAYSFERLEQTFADHGITLSKAAFDLSVDFNGIVATFGRFHRNLRFDLFCFPGHYSGWGVAQTSRIVGKALIPFALDDDGYVWLVADDGQIYTDWSDIICLQGKDILSALAGALIDHEGELITT